MKIRSLWAIIYFSPEKFQSPGSKSSTNLNHQVHQIFSSHDKTVEMMSSHPEEQRTRKLDKQRTELFDLSLYCLYFHSQWKWELCFFIMVSFAIFANMQRQKLQHFEFFCPRWLVSESFFHNPSTCNGENGPPAVDTALLAGLPREYASLYGQTWLTNIVTTCLAIRSPYVRNSRSRGGCKYASLHGLSPDSLLISSLTVEPLLPSHSNQLGSGGVLPQTH